MLGLAARLGICDNYCDNMNRFKLFTVILPLNMYCVATLCGLGGADIYFTVSKRVALSRCCVVAILRCHVVALWVVTLLRCCIVALSSCRVVGCCNITPSSLGQLVLKLCLPRRSAEFHKKVKRLAFP